MAVPKACSGVSSEALRGYLHRSGMVFAVVVLVVVTSACAMMTEPPHFPAAIRNLLDEPVEIYEYSVENPDASTFVVDLDPGALHELPSVGNQCHGNGLVALGSDGEVGRLEDRCRIDSDEVWVLHAEGQYVTDYVGDDTYYYRD